MRLVTWNVHACRAGVDKIVDQLRTLEPDVICLQEVECAGLSSPDDHEARRIAADLGMNHVSSAYPDGGTEEEQIVIMYRGALRHVEVLRASPRRCYAVAACLDWHGREVRIVAVHLTSNATDQVGRFVTTGIRRLKEADDLARRADGWKGDTILAGDFNSVPGMVELLVLSTRFRCVSHFEPTHPSDHPVLTLDHVFCKGTWKATSSGTEPSNASDHLPLVATLRCTAGVAAEPATQPAGPATRSE
jgi:endonuclease/exonuclease/phosphatase family metal-dependent hydrolase